MKNNKQELPNEQRGQKKCREEEHKEGREEEEESIDITHIFNDKNNLVEL